MRKLLLALSALAVSLSGQTKFEFWPGAAYDPSVPAFQKVLGYEPGEKIAPHADIVRYFEALAAAAPSRMKVFEYGRTWEGRKLIYGVVSSEANIKRLGEIQASMKKLADPRKTSETEAKKIISSLPVVIWLAYGVHGNEISSCDAALYTAYHLLAARSNKTVDEIMANVVVLIDPTQNPDGRARFITNFDQMVGLEPDASPVAAERAEPWPGGRSNHYFFDMNRDWIAVTQPETKGRIKMLQEWYPLVTIDLHEMGSEGNYYFTPEADPFNPHLTKEQRTSLDWFGKNNAKYFDQFGYSYFTREVYDAFYPGYGASWPEYYGAIAATYENASVRGLVYRRADDSLYTYRDSVRKHFISSIATAETSAQYRVKLEEQFYAYRKTAIEEGQKEPVKEYVLPRRGDVSAVDKLAALLVEHGVEVQRAKAEFGGYPAGSYVISMAQPMKRFIRTAIDPDVKLEEWFMKEQERRRKKKLPDEIYDVTGWSLPLVYNVECIGNAAASQGSFEPYKPGTAPKREIKKASVAYLVPWDQHAAANFLTGALRAGLRVHSTDKAFTQNGRKFPAGTLIVKVKENGESLHETVVRIAGVADVVPTDTGWVDDGVNFGSRYVSLMKKPVIAMAWDRPVSALSAGAARFVLERQFGYPVTVVRVSSFGAADLSKFDAIVLPDAGQGGSYADAFGPNGIRRLKEWVGNGGTLIGIQGGMSFLADARVGLLAVSPEALAREKKAEPVKPEPGVAQVPGKLLTSDGDFESAIQPDTGTPDAVQGVIVRARVDQDHWLSVGVPPTVMALAEGRTMYTPVKLDKGVNVAYFETADKLVASGYMWKENKAQMAYKPLAVVAREGRGTVIGFSADPNFRGYMDSLNMLFVNAVFRGVAHSR
jgi:hypothetical protein